MSIVGVENLDMLNTEPMHISLLYPEIFEHIYQYLPAEDLEKCLEVNQQWRSNANQIWIWRKCLNYINVEDEGDETQLEGPEELCRPARMWMAFRNSTAYNWLRNIRKTFELIVILPVTISKKWKITINSDNFFQKFTNLSQTTKEYFLNPTNNGQLVETFENFAVFRVDYCFLMYKFEGNRLNLQMVIDTTTGEPIVVPFADTHRSRGYRRLSFPLFFIKFDELEKRMLLRLCRRENGMNYWNNYWVNINTQIVSPIRLVGRIDYITKNKLLIDNGTLFKVYERDGSNERTIDTKLINIRTNDNILVGYSSINDVFEIWDLETGEQIPFTTNLIENFYILHPTRDIIYTREEGRIKAISARTGETKWESSGVMQYWNMKIVCNRYLVAYTYGKTNNDIYVFNANNGELLHKIPVLQGDVDYICDDCIIVNITNDVNSYHYYVVSFSV